MAGLPKEGIEAALQELLRSMVSVGGQATRGNREKVITILMRTWVTIPGELESFRDEGLSHVAHTPQDQHMAVHWGMVMTIYPFWGMVAETVGRLLRLQRTAAATQVQRRLREQLGERETVARAARRVLRTFVDWGVLAETHEKGVYTAATPRPLANQDLAVWLLEAALRAADTTAVSLKAAGQTPALFPFAVMPLTVRAFAGHPRLDVTRQGGTEDLLVLRYMRIPNPVAP